MNNNGYAGMLAEMDKAAAMLKDYDVNIDFRTGPSFRTQVKAHRANDAKEIGLRMAKECGYDGKTKKIVADEVRA